MAPTEKPERAADASDSPMLTRHDDPAFRERLRLVIKCLRERYSDPAITTGAEDDVS